MASDLEQDIIPVTELIHHTAHILQKIKRTKRPILITQNGRAAMVCLDVKEYQKQIKRLALIDSILAGERAFAAGDFTGWDDFEAELDQM